MISVVFLGFKENSYVLPEFHTELHAVHTALLMLIQNYLRNAVLQFLKQISL